MSKQSVHESPSPKLASSVSRDLPSSTQMAVAIVRTLASKLLDDSACARECKASEERQIFKGPR